jgi:chromosome segregation ATPase
MKAYRLQGGQITEVEVDKISNGLYWVNGARYSCFVGRVSFHETEKAAAEYEIAQLREKRLEIEAQISELKKEVVRYYYHIQEAETKYKYLL